MIPIPWMVAMALQADGWYLRSDIIWAKPNPMPESVTDRPTKAHEYLFLLSKNERYFYDAEAIKEKSVDLDGWEARCESKFNGRPNLIMPDGKAQHIAVVGSREVPESGLRNKRTVWTVPTSPYPEAHFATYPPDLIKPCILAGTSAAGCCARCGAPMERLTERETGTPASFNGSSFNSGKTHDVRAPLAAVGTGERTVSVKTTGWHPTCDCYADRGANAKPLTIPCTVLDPFGGSGTTGMVALELGRKAILIELNPKYAELAKTRCHVTPGLPLSV